MKIEKEKDMMDGKV